MIVDEEDNFERELREHLSRELDPQRGRALIAFESELWRGRRRRLMLIAGSSLAAAASIVVVGSIWLSRPVTSPPRIAQAPSNVPSDVIRLVAWETSDEGIELIDPRRPPIRTIRQEGVQQVQWFDPNRNATMRLIVPQEQLILIEEQTY